MAFGAEHTNVVFFVLRSGAIAVIGGLAAGIGFSLARRG